MIKFRTEISPPKSSFQLNHSDSVVLSGSCFSDHIGLKLGENKFEISSNPLGISYNPISLHKLFFKLDELNWEMAPSAAYSSPYLHSDYNGLNLTECQLNYESAFSKQEQHLKNSNTIFITYGTAYVHELKSNNTIVNNCHKRDASLFQKRLLAIDEIVDSWNQTYSQLKSKFQKDFQFIFTLSPVRHMKDGFHENQLSKSTLKLAIEEICQQYENCSYFPAYELLLDDLRDYRYYDKDLLHPNEMAIDYIWNKFSQSYFSPETLEVNNQIQKIRRSLQHRPFIEQSLQHVKFLNSLIQKMEFIQKNHQIDYSKELKFTQSQLSDLS